MNSRKATKENARLDNSPVLNPNAAVSKRSRPVRNSAPPSRLGNDQLEAMVKRNAAGAKAAAGVRRGRPAGDKAAAKRDRLAGAKAAAGAKVEKLRMKSKKKQGKVKSSPDVDKWSKNDVAVWLHTFSFGDKYEVVFRENDIDGRMLFELDDTVLKNELNIVHSLHRKRILREIQVMSDLSTVTDPSAAVSMEFEEVDEPKTSKKKRKSATTPKTKRPVKKVKTPKEVVPTIPAGKKKCRQCDALSDSSVAMCMSCMKYVFPEKSATIWSSVCYDRKTFKSRDRSVSHRTGRV